MATGVDPSMLAPAERVARFIETLDPTAIEDAFADSDVTIIENFAPYRFAGSHAVEDWTAGMTAHRAGTSNLSHVLGAAQDFSRTGNRVFFSLPTTWTGLNRNRPFTETGGWAFVLLEQRDGWRVQSYGWAVTTFLFD